MTSSRMFKKLVDPGNNVGLFQSCRGLSRLGWKSLETWMSHFQVSQDLDESLSSLSRLGWVNLDEVWIVVVWIVVTRTYLICWKSRHAYAPIICMQHLFWVFLHILLWWTSLKSKEPKVCVQERMRERKRKKKRENKVFNYYFLKKTNSRQKIKIKIKKMPC